MKSNPERSSVILSRADGEGSPAHVRWGSFAVCAAQDDTKGERAGFVIPVPSDQK